MTKSRLEGWLIFAGWVIGLAACAVIDHIRQATACLTAYSISTAILAVFATRKRRPRNYKFKLVRPGVVRSADGFEVRASSSRLEYIEGDRVVSWPPAVTGDPIAKFSLSAEGIRGWDDPFSTTPMHSDKKRDVAKATMSALLYLQLVEAGKIRPRKRVESTD